MVAVAVVVAALPAALQEAVAAVAATAVAAVALAEAVVAGELAVEGVTTATRDLLQAGAVAVAATTLPWQARLPALHPSVQHHTPTPRTSALLRHTCSSRRKHYGVLKLQSSQVVGAPR